LPGLVLEVLALCLGVRPLLDSLCERTESRWLGARLLSLGALVVLALLLARWSSRNGWDERHVLAVAAGALISPAVVALTVDPLGHVPRAAKLDQRRSARPRAPSPPCRGHPAALGIARTDGCSIDRWRT
jgi:hypothetical protein